jgi:hypothetical protein
LLPLQPEVALYRRTEVEAEAQGRQEGRAWRAAAQLPQQAEKAAAQLAKKAERAAGQLAGKAKRDKAKAPQCQAAKAAAGRAEAQLLQSSSKKRSRDSKAEKHGDVMLPDAVLQHIMACLAVCEPDGVRGPSMAANDLANCSLVSACLQDSCKRHLHVALSMASAWLAAHACKGLHELTSSLCQLHMHCTVQVAGKQHSLCRLK